MGAGVWLRSWMGAFINPGKKFLPNSGVAGTAIAMVLQSDISVHVHVHL